MTFCPACYGRKVYCRRCRTVHCQCSWNHCPEKKPEGNRRPARGGGEEPIGTWPATLAALLHKDCADLLEKAEAEVERLRGLLDQYAQHDNGCTALWRGGMCECGLDEASGTPPDPTWEEEE
jgi:hypothetical protein